MSDVLIDPLYFIYPSELEFIITIIASMYINWIDRQFVVVPSCTVYVTVTSEVYVGS